MIRFRFTPEELFLLRCRARRVAGGDLAEVPAAHLKVWERYFTRAQHALTTWAGNQMLKERTARAVREARRVLAREWRLRRWFVSRHQAGEKEAVAS